MTSEDEGKKDFEPKKQKNGILLSSFKRFENHFGKKQFRKLLFTKCIFTINITSTTATHQPPHH